MLGVEKYEGDSTFAKEQANGTEFAWFMGQDTWESYVRGGWVGKVGPNNADVTYYLAVQTMNYCIARLIRRSR